MMIGEYNSEKYMANVEGENIDISTCDREKCSNGFIKEWIYYTKQISIDDAKLKNLYEIQFSVSYQGETWDVDVDHAAGLHESLKNCEVVIYSTHGASDDTWIHYDKGLFAKVINLFDCSDCFIKKTYLKRDGICLSEKISETTSISASILKDEMLTVRHICYVPE